METKEVIERARTFAKPFRVTDGTSFSLKDIDPGDTLDLGTEDRPRAKEALATGIEALAELQDMLYAQDRCIDVTIMDPIPDKSVRCFYVVVRPSIPTKLSGEIQVSKPTWPKCSRKRLVETGGRLIRRNSRHVR